MIKDSNKTQTAIIILCVCVCLLWFISRIGLGISSGLIEGREIATISAAYAMNDGNFGSIPDNVYMYGPVQPFILSFFTKSSDIILTNRIILLLFLIGSTVFVALSCARWLKWKGSPISNRIILLSTLGYLYPFFYEMPICLATPAFTGVFFSSMILYVSLCKFRGKYVVLGLIWVLSTLCKPYFILFGTYIIASILLVDNKKHICKNTLILICTTTICALPLICNVQTQNCLIHCLSTSRWVIRHTVQKTFLYFCVINPIIITILYISAFFLFQSKERFLNIVHINPKRLLSRSLSLLEKSHYPNLFINLIVFCCIIFIIRLSGHPGLWGILYHPQVLAAPMSLLLTMFLSKASHIKAPIYIFAMLLSLSVVTMEFMHWKRESIYNGNDFSLEKVVLNDIKQHKKIRFSAATSIYELRNNGSITENGQLQYLSSLSTKQEKLKLPHLINLSNSNRVKIEDYYKKEILQPLQTQKWDVIYTDSFSIIPRGYGASSSLNDQIGDLLHKNYTPTHKFHSNIPSQQHFLVTRWERKR